VQVAVSVVNSDGLPLDSIDPAGQSSARSEKQIAEVVTKSAETCHGEIDEKRKAMLAHVKRNRGGMNAQVRRRGQPSVKDVQVGDQLAPCG
jgi:hypothetical protein